nr:exo-alpha-sialidase [Armatimonadota bacterium]
MRLRSLTFGIVGLAMVANAADTIVGPQIRTDANGGTAAANETSAAAFDPLGNELVGTYNDWRAGGETIRMGVSVSNDAGSTWTDFWVRPPANNQSNVEGDPMTAFDARTGTLWVGAISFRTSGGVFVARKDPGANTFQPSVMARVSSGADKGWMAAGPLPGNPNATNLYVTYNEGCLRSSDMGQTWSTPVNLGSGIGFNPKVAPNGNLYVTYWDFGTGVMFRKSTNGGVSFTAPVRAATRLDTWGTQDGSRGPGNFRKPPMNGIAVDPNTGHIYIVYFDTTNIVNGNRNLNLYMVTSTNEGATWSTPMVINADADPPGDQFFPWIEVDYKGRIHNTWFDSRHTVQNDTSINGFYDNYYSFSDDGGDTWTEFRLTSSPWSSGNDGLDRGQQFLGDYNALAFGGNRAYPYYLSTQNGDPDIFTNIVIDPDVVPASYVITRGQGGGSITTLFKSDDVRLSVD